MGRPTDWWILDLDGDPVPGNPPQVQQLARKLHDFAEDVGSALRSIKGLSGDNAVQSWTGLSGDEYRSQFDDLPGELTKLEHSYRMAGEALDAYWPKLEQAQSDADRALQQGREARDKLGSAQSNLTTANAWVTRANAKAKEYQDSGGKSDVPQPSEAEVRAAAHNATQATNAQTSAQSAVDSAQAKLDAAKELANQAKGVRDDAARNAKDKLGNASDAGIKNKHWWEKAVDWVADHWDEIVAVCKVIVAVLGIVVMIIGGPLAWVVLAAALIVLADTVMKYLQGKASLWDVAFAALDCVPGMKGLTTAGGLLKMAKEAPELLRTGKALENLANGIRKGGSAIRQAGRSVKKLVTCGDPVDVATGEVVMSATDVELPGVLPLVLERHHRSSYRAGRFFGPSWASTLDQRLLLDADGIRYTTEDGMILYYPVPTANTPTTPIEGPRWPLTWDGTPAGPMTITRPELGHTYHFTPQTNPAELPITAITDRNNNHITIEYTPHGTPNQIIHHGGYRIGIETTNNTITTLRLLNDPNQPTLLRYGYDSDHNLAAITNSSGLPLKLTYDAHHRITRWEDRNGTWYEYTYDNEGRCTHTTGTDGLLEYSYHYDEANHRTSVTNSLGHTTVYQFNGRFQLIAETDPLGHTTTREWDRYDRLQSVTDQLGLTTSYTYDEGGYPTAVIRPDGSRTTAENGEHGLPVVVTQADGRVWRMEYDSRGNLTSETDPTGAQAAYTYNDIGTVTAITDAAGHTVLFETDATGMPVASTDAEGSTTRLERDAFGRLVAKADPDGASTRFGYTLEGRVSLRTLPDGTTERRVYDGEGNLVEHVDAAGQVTRFEYGGFDQPAVRIEPDGSRLEFTYDGELRVTSVTNQLGGVWRYSYDAAGRLAREEDFTGRAQSYRHDAAGRLVEQTNGAGESTVYRRNELGKVVEERTPEGVTTFAYDPVGNVLQVHGGHAKLTYERDALGRVIAETCNGATVRSAYDVLGRRIRRVTPSGAESVWEYDGRDRPTLLRTAGRTVKFSYDAAGREVERRAGAAVLTQTWDPNGRLSSQTLTARDVAGALEPRRVQRRTYHYRPDGTVSSIDDLVHGDRVFDIDRTGRITGVQAATWSEHYAYDAAGNLTQGRWQENQPARPAGTGPVRGSGNVRYDHDAQGRVVQRRKKRLSRKPDVWQYTWDSQDRLVAVVTPDGTRWAYRYDPFGRRIAKERLAPDGDGVVERVLFAWDGFVPAEQTTLVDDEAPRCTVWDWERDRFSPVTQVDRVAPRDRPQEWIDRQFYSVVTDLVGTPSELVDDEGEAVWRARITLWGANLDDPRSGRASCPLRFPGQYHDPETALNYNYQRHYDPETGQYMSLDPLGLAPGPNPRAYVPNPFTTVDPLGLAPECAAAAEAARKAARDRADLEQARPGANKHTRPTSAAGLSVPGHDVPFSGASVKGGGTHDLHKDVQAAYDRVPEELRSGGQHGRCGEAEALSNAMKAGVDPRGGTMAAVNVRAPGNPAHGTPKAPCSSCQHVLDQFGITAVT